VLQRLSPAYGPSTPIWLGATERGTKPLAGIRYVRMPGRVGLVLETPAEEHDDG
jgi:hypothetical protein